MKFMVLLLALSGYVVLAKSSIDQLPVHPGVGGLYKGPNSETIIKGPDGSVITAEAAGGVIQTQPDVEPIIVEDPIILQSVSPKADISIAPEVVTAETVPPLVHTIEIIQPDPHIIETEIVDAPAVEPQQATGLVGPSGSISTRGSSSVISGPASTTISEPAKVLIATPIVPAVPIIASVKTPLQVAPVVEVVPDIPVPTTSFMLEPTIQSVNGASISGSTLSPLINLGSSVGNIHPPVSTITETTLAPPHWNLVPTPAPSLSSTVANSQHLVSPGAAAIETISSLGVIENAGGAVPISSTIRPEVSVVSTGVPSVSEGDFQNSLNYALVNNRQLSINPSLIHSANIIPPEIRPLPSSTVTVSTTSDPLPTVDAPNIHDVRKFYVQATPNGNQRIGVTEHVPLSGINSGIPSDGLVASGLAKYGIDSSQINLAQVPLSSVRSFSSSSPLRSSLDEEIDGVSSTLWNRYGRGVESKEKKR